MEQDDLSSHPSAPAPETRYPPFFGEIDASLDEGRHRHHRFFGDLYASLDHGRGRPPRFFNELGASLDDVQQADRRRRLHFFAQLSPRLEAARALERELDRHLARRFNVFDYLSTDEVALSRIIADLLDPGARHGQGTRFLRALLDELTEIDGPPDPDAGSVKGIHVATERVIAIAPPCATSADTRTRRLDVSVEIPGTDRPYCLAIENKPYADDQRNQVGDYLLFLDEKYGDRFLLIYLSPTGQGPSSWSLPPEELPKWTGRLAVMGYWSGSEQHAWGDRYDGFRVGLSLAAWFSACRRRCEPDRLRWFLREAEVFCKRRFGGHPMTTDRETRTIMEYLFDNPEHLETAQSVSDAWLKVKEVLCRGFLEHLCAELAKEARTKWPDIAGDLRVECTYGGEKYESNRLWLHRANWKPWKGHDKKHPPYKGCTAIILRSGWSYGPNHWHWGVLHPRDKSGMSDADAERRRRLEDGLRSEFDGVDVHSGGWWAYERSVDDEMGHWNALLPTLYEEWKGGGGRITDFYVNGMMNIAAKAIPIIDEIDGTG